MRWCVCFSVVEKNGGLGGEVCGWTLYEGVVLLQGGVMETQRWDTILSFGSLKEQAYLFKLAGRAIIALHACVWKNKRERICDNLLFDDNNVKA